MKQPNNNMSIQLAISLCFILLSIKSMAQNKDTMDLNEKTTLVVTSKSNPNDLASLQIYVEKVMPMLMSLEGKVIKRSKVSDVFYGNSPGEFLLIMDFPIKQKLVDFFNSDEYKSIIPYRDNGFSEINILFADDLK